MINATQAVAIGQAGDLGRAGAEAGAGTIARFGFGVGGKPDTIVSGFIFYFLTFTLMIIAYLIKKARSFHRIKNRIPYGNADFLVPGTGLEPASLAALAPKASVSTNSTIRACKNQSSYLDWFLLYT